jgi:hypothetical protein
MNRSEDHIDITIRVGNSRDWKKITVGRSYYFNMKRGTLIKDLRKEFIKIFPEELEEELERYSIYTKKFIRLYDNNVVEDAFSEKEDSDLNIYDKDETMFYAVMS